MIGRLVSMLCWTWREERSWLCSRTRHSQVPLPATSSAVQPAPMPLLDLQSGVCSTLDLSLARLRPEQAPEHRVPSGVCSTWTRPFRQCHGRDLAAATTLYPARPARRWQHRSASEALVSLRTTGKDRMRRISLWSLVRGRAGTSLLDTSFRAFITLLDSHLSKCR